MGRPLTDRVALTELADREQVIESKGVVEQLPRLAAALEAELKSLPADVARPSWRRYPVTITLRFGWADGRRRYAALDGRAAARIAAVCQRCLEPFDQTLHTDLKLVLLKPGDEAAEVPGFEAWELDDPVLRPIDIVDEALVMAMPLAAMHETDCRPMFGSTPRDPGTTTRPFADLRSRMRDAD